MQLSSLDWFVVASYGLIALVTGLYFARRAGTDMQEFFLSGRIRRAMETGVTPDGVPAGGGRIR